MKILQMSCLRGACAKALLGCFGRFLFQDIARSSPAAAGPFMTILWGSLRGPGPKIFVRRFCRNPGEIFSEVLAVHALVWVLARRSCGDPVDPPQEALALRSLRCSALVLV